MSMVHQRVWWGAIGLLVVSITSAYEKADAPTDVLVGRYSVLKPLATPEQADILQTVIQVQFPQQVTTVGEALDYLLLRSGYRLAETRAMDPGMRILLSRPLPEVHRTLGPITIEEALKTLAGHVYRLVVDPLNRLIAFDVKDKYHPLMSVSAPLIRPRPIREMGPSRVGAKAVPEEPLVDEAEAVEAKPLVPEEKLDSKLYGAAPIETAPLRQANPPTTLSCINPYRVKGSETLSEIAVICARQVGVSVHKMAYGLYKGNPNAFAKIGGVPNMNLLMAEKLLKIPTAVKLAKLSESEAIRFQTQQRELWKQQK